MTDADVKKKLQMESCRSMVRIVVTYMAAGFVFLGGGAFVFVLIRTGDIDDTRLRDAKDLFMTILPIATGIVTYWFGNRTATKADKDKDTQT